MNTYANYATTSGSTAWDSDVMATMESARLRMAEIQRGPDAFLLMRDQYEALKRKMQLDTNAIENQPFSRNLFGLPIEVFDRDEDLLKRVTENIIADKPQKLAFCDDGGRLAKLLGSVPEL